MPHSADIDERIARLLAGEAGTDDQNWLVEWLAASPDNRRYFEQMQQLWQGSEQALPPLPHPIDVEAALTKTKTRISRADPVKTARKIALPRYWPGLAAALILLLAAIWFLRPETRTDPILIAAESTPRHDTLPDGSMISLNRQSSLRAVFDGRSRRVEMQGEAWFEVAPDAAKPFVVELKNVSVTVVGTKFNIDNYGDSNKVVVSVEEGKVKIQVGAQIFFLSAGEQAEIDCRNGEVLRKTLQPSGNVSAWANRVFVFDETPLSAVLPLLESTYGVRIQLSDQRLERCLLHARFNDETIEKIMAIIAETFSLRLTVVNGDYYLEGEGCGDE